MMAAGWKSGMSFIFSPLISICFGFPWTVVMPGWFFISSTLVFARKNLVA